MSIFSKIRLSLSGFFNPAKKLIAAELGAKGVAIVQEAVLAAERINGTGAEKRAEALRVIRIGVRRVGLEVSELALRLALEFAVAALRAKK